MIPSSYKKLSFKTVGEFTEQMLAPHFKSLHEDLKHANIRMPLIEYLSVALFTAIITFFFETILFTVIFFIITGSPFFSLMISVTMGAMSGTGIFFMFNTYPSIRLGERQKRIEGMLPFAVLYLSTIAGTGTPPITMFKALARFKEYGEIAEESESIVNEVQGLGYTLSDALSHAAERTPAKDLEELFWGIRTIIATGGDLREYLHGKSDSAMQEYRRQLKAFAETLAMFIEIYITVVIVGSVFFMILTTIMGSMGGSSMQSMIIGAQIGVVFIFLPVASLSFLVMTEGITPHGG